MTIDTTNMCSHLQKKLFEEDGIYHPLWIAMQDDPGLTAVGRKSNSQSNQRGQNLRFCIESIVLTSCAHTRSLMKSGYFGVSSAAITQIKDKFPSM